MKQAIFFLLDEYADWEGAYLASTLNQSADWEVKTASIQPTVTTIGGFTTVTDYLIDAIPQDLDLLILIGGNSWAIEDDRIKPLVASNLARGTVIGAICGAVDYLARNGFLNDYLHTGNTFYFWNDSEYDNVKSFIEEQAVRDRNLITANGTATLEFTELVLKAVNFSSEEEIEKSVTMHKLGYYQFCEKYGNPYLS